MTLKSLVSALAGYVGARFLGAGLGLLTQLVLARALSPADVAIVFMAMSAAAFLSLLMMGGEAQLASTHLPKLFARGQERVVTAFHSVALRNLVTVFASLCVVLAVLWVSGVMRPDIMLALGVGLLCSPMSALARYQAMVANSLRWFPLSYVPDFIVRPGLFLLAIVALVLFGWQHNVVAVLAAFAFFVWATTVGQTLMMQGRGLHFRHWFDRRVLYARTLRPRSLALLVVATVSYAFADIVMLLAGFLLEPQDAAVAGVTIRLAAIAGFVLQAAQLFVLPDYAEAVTKRNSVKANALLWRMNGLTLLAVLAALIGAVLLGRFVLSLFGEVYAGGWMLLVLFLVGQSVRALGGMNQNLLALEGHQIKTAWSCIVALVILVSGAVLLCRALGPLGLGYAVIAAEVAWLFGLAAMAQRLCGKRADLLWLARNS